MTQLRKVLLADDDAMMRIGLKTMMNWRQHGYVLVGDASNGEEALALALQEAPDIVITDMKMPRMDGIALIRALRALPHPPFIVALSSYDDFSLVREALRLGAADYLLKLELTAPMLLDCLSAAAPQPASPAAAPDRNLERNRALRDLVSHFYLDAAEIEQRLTAVGVSFPADTVYCLLLKAGELFRFEEATEEEYQTLRFSVINIAQEIAGDCLLSWCVEGKTGEFYILGSVRETLAQEDPDALVNLLAQRLRDMLAQYLDLSCTIGIGRGTPDGAGLAQACRQAADAMRSRFFAPTDHDILWWQHSLPTPITDGHNPLTALCPRLAAALAAFDRQAVSALLAQCCHLLQTQPLSRRAVLFALLELSTLLRDFFERTGTAVSTQLPNSRCNLPDLVLLQTTGETVRWLQTLALDLDAYLAAEPPQKGLAAVNRARALIAAQYPHELSLQQLAQTLELTPGYLSALMKKYTGMSFSEYITEVRLTAAKRLLLETSDKVYTIAAQVGYDDPYYFSRLFKRATGRSPGDWRRYTAAPEGLP